MTQEDSEVVTPEQRAAIESKEQYLSIIAGPGTGKTFTLAQRIAAQIHAGADPETLVAASFTNDASGALRLELTRLVGDVASKINITTVHAFSRFIVEKEMAKTLPGATLSIADEWDTKTLLKGLKPYITPNKVRNLPLEDLKEIASFNDYVRRLKTHQLTDFRHLLIRAQEVAQSVAIDYTHIFWDEFQDTSPEQFALLKQLVKGNPQLAVTVVGDPNQAIYGTFSDSNNGKPCCPFSAYNELVSPTVCRLSLNFRASQSLVNFTNSQMPVSNPQVSGRVDDTDSPKLVCLGHTYGFQEGDHVVDEALVHEVKAALTQYENVAVLTYTNKAVAHIIELLNKKKIPSYSKFNKVMFDQPNLRLVFFLFRYAKHESQVQLLSLIDQAKIITATSRRKIQTLTEDFTLPILEALPKLGRVKNKDQLQKFKRAIQVAVIDLKVSNDIEEVRNAVKRVLRTIPGAEYDSHVKRLFDAVEAQQPSFDPGQPIVSQFMEHFQESVLIPENTVEVKTIHSSKGLEWPAVIIPYLGTGDSYRFYQPWAFDFAYLKALYVGMTRARDNLTMLSSGRCSHLDGSKHLRTVYPFKKDTRVNVDAQKRFPKLFSPLQPKPSGWGLVQKRGLHMTCQALGFLKNNI